tara:strand:- start:72897 stop:73613 length:717 start_codon:yes stop_codon:yes gene_type:complete
MSAANLLHQLAQSLEESSDLSAVKIYNQQWMLKCVAELIAKGTLIHDDLTFPEDSKWCSDAAVLQFNSTNAYSGIAVTVGHIQVNKKKRNYPKWNYIEIKQYCSCLYSITSGWRFKSDVLTLMKLVYDGLKDRKITKIPHKIACYALPYKDFELNDFEEVKEKEIIKAKIINEFNSYHQENLVRKDEEIHWVLNNIDPFMEKLKIKVIPWEDLLMFIENTETRAYTTAFYNKWNEYKL